MFGFPKKDETTSVESEKSESSGIWSTQLKQALADAHSGKSSSKKRNERGSATREDEGSRPSVSTRLAEQAKKLFDPEAWRAIVRAPFALGKVMTGRTCWELDKTQEDTLATSTSMTAEYFMAVDPKYVALTICMFNWAVVLTEKYAENAKLARAEKQSQEKPKVVGIGLA